MYFSHPIRASPKRIKIPPLSPKTVHPCKKKNKSGPKQEPSLLPKTKDGKTFGPAHSLPQFLWWNPGVEIWTHEAKNEDLRIWSQQWMVDWPNNFLLKKSMHI